MGYPTDSLSLIPAACLIHYRPVRPDLVLILIFFVIFLVSIPVMTFVVVLLMLFFATFLLALPAAVLAYIEARHLYPKDTRKP